MRSAKQQVKILKEISKRYPREETVSMSRSDFKSLCETVGKELFG